MAEVIATALLKVVFDKLSSAVMTEFGKLMGLDKQLRKLESALSTIQDVLEDAEARQVKEKALKGWLRKLKDVAYDADDVLDEIAVKAVKWRPDREHKLTRKVRNLLLISKSPAFCHKIANRINEIMEKLDEIAEERSKFHLREGFVGDSETDSCVRETCSLIEESEVYGRGQEKEKIVDFLLNVFDESKPGVIAIVGLGGVGKTTVAQLAYNDERVCKHFERRIWVSVPMDFDNKKLCKSILESITEGECNLTDMDLMQRSLKEHVANKKFLLVLDDVWNENPEKWDRLRIALTSGSKGSKIVVTTRSQRVASVMGSVAQCLLTGLSEDDCFALFVKRAFGVGGAEMSPSLEAMGREIVKKCGGVPLAAKALGGLMRFRREESMWLAIKDSEIWRLSDDDNGILPALKLSYNHLPSHLKQCFAYCSIFPRAFEVSKNTLVELWIAEGFIRSSGGNGNLEDLGFQFVDELLSRSFFQNDTELGGVVGKLKMHDLVHDLARSIAGDECSIIDASTGRGTTQSSHYSSFICDGEILSNLEPLCEARKLRTFHLIASKNISEGHHKAEELLHVLFSSSRVLRALHLKNLPIKSLPNSINKLRHLRYLNLSHTHIDKLPPNICTLQNLEILDLNNCQSLEELPNSIGSLLNLLSLNLFKCYSLLSLPSSIGHLQKLRNLDLSSCPIKTFPKSLSCLSNLQMLDLHRCGYISELPENIKDMRNLVHLDIYGCYGLTCMPVGIGQLSRLRTLPMFVLGGKNKCSITELGALNLEGQLKITGLEIVDSTAEARKANLKEKYGIQTLGFSWKASIILGRIIRAFQGTDDGEESLESCIEALIYQWDIYSKTAEDVLEALRPHTSLKNLSIHFFEGRTLPLWMRELSLPSLTSVSLSSCIRCTRLPAFGQLPCLEVLTLSDLPAIKCLGSEFYGGNDAFPILKELNLSGMSELEEWQSPSDGDVFPGLAKLSLFECPKLRALPSTFPSVINLGMNVDDWLLLSSLQNGAFPNLKHLTIGNFDDDVGLPELLSNRISAIESWSVKRKPKPSSSDSTSMSLSGFGYVEIRGGRTTVELPIW